MKKLDRISNPTKRSAMRKILLSLSLFLIMMFSATDVEANYVCPPGWYQGDSITHLIDVNGTPTVITIYWCFRPSQNGSPYSDIYIGGWSISPDPGPSFSLFEEDITKLIVAYKYSELGFIYPFQIPVYPNKTPELFRVYNGGCYMIGPPPIVTIIPCDPYAPPQTCVEGYIFWYEFGPGGNLELVTESVGMTYDFECFFPCFPICN